MQGDSKYYNKTDTEIPVIPFSPEWRDEPYHRNNRAYSPINIPSILEKALTLKITEQCPQLYQTQSLVLRLAARTAKKEHTLYKQGLVQASGVAGRKAFAKFHGSPSCKSKLVCAR